MVRFREFLTEGTIQLPSKLTKEVTDFIIVSYIAYVKIRIAKKLEGEDKNHALAMLQDICKKHQVNMPEDHYASKLVRFGSIKREFEIEKDDVPSKYAAKLEKLGINIEDHLAKLSNEEKLEVEFNIQENPSTKEAGRFISSDMVMKFSIKHLDMLIDDKRQLTIKVVENLLHNRLEELIGTVTHELTHLVQYFILQAFHSKQIEKKFSQDEIESGDDKNYHNSPVEFDPWIKSEASYINGLISLLKEIGKSHLFDKSKELAHFTGADDSADSDTEKFITRKSTFFANLKKQDADKWKKAIKNLTQLVK